MLVLICGLPRAGKTTYSERFENVIHLDTCHAYRGVIHAMRGAEDVVVEGVYNYRHLREELIGAYEGNGSKCIWLDTPDEVRRMREGWCEACDKPFEPPTYDEGWDEIRTIRSGYDDSCCHEGQA